MPRNMPKKYLQKCNFYLTYTYRMWYSLQRYTFPMHRNVSNHSFAAVSRCTALWSDRTKVQIFAAWQRVQTAETRYELLYRESTVHAQFK